MIVSDSLLQFYFLGVHPAHCRDVAEKLANTPPPNDKIGRWHIYSRLTRPGLIIGRRVQCTIGLDLFLLNGGKGSSDMKWIEDVAEVMTFGYADDLASAADPLGPGEITSVPDSLWQQCSQEPAAGCLFCTFLRLNWDVLSSKSVWERLGLRERPGRAEILTAIRRLLTEGWRRTTPDLRPITFDTTGGTGDCDLLVSGIVNERAALDRFLLIITQLGTDCIAGVLGAPPEKVEQATEWHAACAASSTELGVPWKAYCELVTASRQGKYPTYEEMVRSSQVHEGLPATALERTLFDGLDHHLKGGLRAGVFLRRGRNSLANVRKALFRVTPPGWLQQEVLGVNDLLLRQGANTTGSLSTLLLLFARLDAHGDNPDFPLRVSVVLSFDDPTAADLRDAPETPNRPAIFGRASSQADSVRVDSDVVLDESVVQECCDILCQLLPNRWREEFRILERMVERAVTLQRNSDLPRSSRWLAHVILQRLRRGLKRFFSHDAPHPGLRQADEKSGTEIDIRRRTTEEFHADADEYHSQVEDLISAGTDLDRTLSHHARGSTPLLLSTVFQSRMADHFASETVLTAALGASASSVGWRLAQYLDHHAKHLLHTWHGENLLIALEGMIHPIIYASHDPDFMLVRALGIIRVPRWVLWYPTVSSFILHETGHAYFNSVSLEDLAEGVISGILHDRLPPDPEVLKVKWRKDHWISAPRGWIETQSPLAEWVLELAFEWKALKQSDPTSAEYLSAYLGECVAEFFCQRFSYGLEDGCARPVHDTLEHYAPMAHRLPRRQRMELLRREVATRIASAILDSRHASNPWELTREQLEAIIHHEVQSFRHCLWQWINRDPTLHTDAWNELLCQDLDAVWSQLPFPDEGLDPLRRQNGYQTEVGSGIRWGILLVMLARSDVVWQVPPDGPLALTQHMWRAVLTVSRDPENQSTAAEREHESQIVQALAQGKVTHDAVSLWPERLPRRLHAAIRSRDQPERGVAIRSRFALLLTLAAWNARHLHDSPKNFSKIPLNY